MIRKLGIALGSNLGERAENISDALTRLDGLRCSDHAIMSESL